MWNNVLHPFSSLEMMLINIRGQVVNYFPGNENVSDLRRMNTNINQSPILKTINDDDDLI